VCAALQNVGLQASSALHHPVVRARDCSAFSEMLIGLVSSKPQRSFLSLLHLLFHARDVILGLVSTLLGNVPSAFLPR
jgi:hypothetical protein